MKKGCVIYCRVSTSKQAQEGESLDAQEKICRNIAKDKGYKIMPNNKVWRESFSGRKDSRPILDKMLDYVKKHSKEIDCLIFRNIDRLTRGGSFPYEKIKNEMTKYHVRLLDSYGVIQPLRNALENTGFKYPWSEYSPSERAEKMEADSTQEEVRRILIRMIGREIELVGQGYHVSPSYDGYKNKKIFENGKKKTIQVENPSRSKYYKKMFQLRASGRYSDEEIVDRLNAIGFKTISKNKWDKAHENIIGKTGGVPLSVKQLQRIIKKPIYCGVICHKWTHYQPIKAKYDGLVDVETFNKANKGKMYIKKINDTLEAVHNYSPIMADRKRLKNNPLFPFKNVILCPYCNKPFLGSSSKGKSGKKFPTYHCSRNHKYFGVNKIEFENNVKKFIEGIEFKKDFIDVIEEIFINEYRKRQKEITRFSSDLSSNVAQLKAEKEQALDALMVASSKVVKNGIEERIDKLEEKILKVQKQRNGTEVSEYDIKDFIGYAKFLMEHCDELLLNTANMHNLRSQQTLFGLVFEEFPNYKDIVNGTPKLSLVFQQKKTSRDEKSLMVARRGIEPLLPG